MNVLPCISVIVPVYNVENYLDKCIDSLLSQTYQNLQIILVDDGSKDCSGRMCDDWAKKDSRIQVIHQENRGLSGARNTGIAAATGEFIMFVDSDDVLSPDLCKTLYDIIDGAQISICNPVHIFPDIPWHFTSSDHVTSFDTQEAIRTMWYQTSFLPSAWGKLFRRALFENHRFTEGRLFEDIDLMHEIFWEATTIRYCDACLYGYVHRENSITTTAFGTRDLDILLVAEKLTAFVSDKPQLQHAARAYTVTAALRVYLNAPKTSQFHAAREQAQHLIQLHGRAVKKDPNIRNKNRLALQLYFTCKPLMHIAYRFINRWK